MKKSPLCRSIALFLATCLALEPGLCAAAQAFSPALRPAAPRAQGTLPAGKTLPGAGKVLSAGPALSAPAILSLDLALPKTQALNLEAPNQKTAGTVLSPAASLGLPAIKAINPGLGSSVSPAAVSKQSAKTGAFALAPVRGLSSSISSALAQDDAAQALALAARSFDGATLGRGEPALLVPETPAGGSALKTGIAPLASSRGKAGHRQGVEGLRAPAPARMRSLATSALWVQLFEAPETRKGRWAEAALTLGIFPSVRALLSRMAPRLSAAPERSAVRYVSWWAEPALVFAAGSALLWGLGGMLTGGWFWAAAAAPSLLFALGHLKRVVYGEKYWRTRGDRDWGVVSLAKTGGTAAFLGYFLFSGVFHLPFFLAAAGSPLVLPGLLTVGLVPAALWAVWGQRLFNTQATAWAGEFGVRYWQPFNRTLLAYGLFRLAFWGLGLKFGFWPAFLGAAALTQVAAGIWRLVRGSVVWNSDWRAARDEGFLVRTDATEQRSNLSLLDLIGTAFLFHLPFFLAVAFLPQAAAPSAVLGVVTRILYNKAMSLPEARVWNRWAYKIAKARAEASDGNGDGERLSRVLYIAYNRLLEAKRLGDFPRVARLARLIARKGLDPYEFLAAVPAMTKAQEAEGAWESFLELSSLSVSRGVEPGDWLRIMLQTAAQGPAASDPKVLRERVKHLRAMIVTLSRGKSGVERSLPRAAGIAARVAGADEAAFRRVLSGMVSFLSREETFGLDRFSAANAAAQVAGAREPVFLEVLSRLEKSARGLSAKLADGERFWREILPFAVERSDRREEEFLAVIARLGKFAARVAPHARELGAALADSLSAVSALSAQSAGSLELDQNLSALESFAQGFSAADLKEFWSNKQATELAKLSGGDAARFGRLLTAVRESSARIPALPLLRWAMGKAAKQGGAGAEKALREALAAAEGFLGSLSKALGSPADSGLAKALAAELEAGRLDPQDPSLARLLSRLETVPTGGGDAAFFNLLHIHRSQPDLAREGLPVQLKALPADKRLDHLRALASLSGPLLRVMLLLPLEGARPWLYNSGALARLGAVRSGLAQGNDTPEVDALLETVLLSGSRSYVYDLESLAQSAGGLWEEGRKALSGFLAETAKAKGKTLEKRLRLLRLVGDLLQIRATFREMEENLREREAQADDWDQEQQEALAQEKEALAGFLAAAEEIPEKAAAILKDPNPGAAKAQALRGEALKPLLAPLVDADLGEASLFEGDAARLREFLNLVILYYGLGQGENKSYASTRMIEELRERMRAMFKIMVLGPKDPAENAAALRRAILEHPANQAEIARLVKAGYDRRLWDKGIEVRTALSAEAESRAQDRKRVILQHSHEIQEDIAPALGYKPQGPAAVLDSHAAAWAFAEVLRAAVEPGLAAASGPERERGQDLLGRVEEVLALIKAEEAGAEEDADGQVAVILGKDFAAEANAGIGVPGCFAPNGVHREMPPAHALEAGAFMARIHEVEPGGRVGRMIANAVVVLTDRGAVVYGSYPGEGRLEYAWSKAWAALAKAAPAVILAPTSAGSRQAFAESGQGRLKPQGLSAVKRATLWTESYHDFGSLFSNGDLSVSLDKAVILGRQDVPKGPVPFIALRLAAAEPAKPSRAADGPAQRQTRPKLSPEQKKDLQGRLFADPLLADIELGGVLRRLDDLILGEDESLLAAEGFAERFQLKPRKGRDKGPDWEERVETLAKTLRQARAAAWASAAP